MKIIVTGATGMVGEGVLLECLELPVVEKVLMVNRKHFSLSHPKLSELIVSDFMDLSKVAQNLSGYHACFFCAGISSVGMKEAEYNHITYEITTHFAGTLAPINPGMVFIYVSGAHTDGTENGNVMWARVKGKTENALVRMPFSRVYNFRPGLMRPVPGQQNVGTLVGFIGKMYPFFKALFPNSVSTLHQVALAMVNSVTKGPSQNILEVRDINELSGVS